MRYLEDPEEERVRTIKSFSNSINLPFSRTRCTVIDSEFFLSTSLQLFNMSDQVKHWHVTYNDIHNLIKNITPKIAKEFHPDLLIAIGLSFQLS